jgi:hypothetical protein
MGVLLYQGPPASQADIGPGTSIQVFHAPRQYQDVPRFETELLVDSHEKRNCKIYL